MSETNSQIKYDISTYASTTAGVVSWYFVPATRLTIDSVYCHFSAAPTATDIFEIAYVPTEGFTYAATMYATNPALTPVGTTKDIAWQPSKPLKLKLGDGIKITWANSWARTTGIIITAVGNEPS
jgi:hypothetical protein